MEQKLITTGTIVRLVVLAGVIAIIIYQEKKKKQNG